MHLLLSKIWKLLSGFAQWHLLWFFHDKFIIGVSGVIINDRNQVLLLRHRYWAEGSWGLPGGYAKKRERLEEALAREVHEETGYSICVESLLQIVSGYRLRLEASYFGRFEGGDLNLEQSEIIEARFFSSNELPDGLLASHRELIDFVFQNLDKGRAVRRKYADN